jgi:predicted glycogen debranching enzyme
MGVESAAHEPLVTIERERLLELDLALTREWLETDGRGGYASSTVLACNTRRYHGLLVAPFAGTSKRHVFLSRLEESVHSTTGAPISRQGSSAGAREFPLSMARYRGLWSPAGHRALERFELAPWPTFVYRIGDARIVRQVLMLKGSPTVLVRWAMESGDTELELRVRPLLAFREADALTHENVDIDARVERLAAGAIRVRPYSALPAMTMSVSAPRQSFEADPVWFRGVEYSLDLERGYDGHEDNFNPGTFVLRLAPGREVVFAATIDELASAPAAAWRAESERRRVRAARAGSGARAQLDLGAEDFLYHSRDGRLGVIAGFPWFGEWGRDTFISLPGLTLARGRLEQCGAMLDRALEFLDDGLMPNIFGSSVEDSNYGSVDASLWFARAVHLFDAAGGDQELVLARLRPALNDIAEQYLRGTALGIRCDDGFLIRAGSQDLNATWMDARTAKGPVTPRDGCAVEINALWYSLLAQLEDLSRRAGDPRAERRWRAFKENAGRSFLARLWLAERRYLADVWKDGTADVRVRPNMVIAAALELSPLSAEQRIDVVQRAELDLLTPRGLRTLAPGDPDYHGRYAGGPEERDNAYHQGTVWPWLIGFFVEASLRAHGPTKANVEALTKLLAGFDGELQTYGLNHVSEVCDGDPPHRPGGCFAQAWSTAELLRAWRLLDAAVVA